MIALNLQHRGLASRRSDPTTSDCVLVNREPPQELVSRLE